MDGFGAGMPAAVGNTPMVELRSLSAATGCTILAKLEYLNASGSIKDRAALAMIDEMAAQGVREAVEATAGNTGIALASMARARGMRFTACVPDTTSGPKVALLRTLADEVVLCSAQAKAGEKDHFQTRAATLAAERGARYCCQFDNPANAAAHRASTGPEMWRQSGQRANAVVLASGTGGTIAGVSQFMAPLGVPCYLANAQSSAVTVEDKTGIVRLKTEEELKHKLPSIIEGIGSGRLYGNLAAAEPLAGCVPVSDAHAIAMTRFLLRHEGFFVGGSSGLNVCAAVRVARTLQPGSVVVTVLCDGGALYLDKHWGPNVLESLGLPPDAGSDLSFLS